MLTQGRSRVMRLSAVLSIAGATLCVHVMLLLAHRSPSSSSAARSPFPTPAPAAESCAAPPPSQAVVGSLNANIPATTAALAALAPPPLDPEVPLSKAWESMPHPRRMLGVDYREPNMLKLLESCRAYRSEYDAWVMDHTPDSYFVRNDMFAYVSAGESRRAT